MYEPGAELSPRARSEFKRVAAAINEPTAPHFRLQELNAVPARVYDGLTVLADGTNWDPGSGQGVYTYYAAAWNKLG